MGYATKPVTKINRLVGDYPPLFQVGFLCSTAQVAAQIRQALGIDPPVIAGTDVNGNPALFTLIVVGGAIGVALAPAGAAPGCAPIMDISNPEIPLSYFPVVVDGTLGIQQI